MIIYRERKDFFLQKNCKIPPFETTSLTIGRAKFVRTPQWLHSRWGFYIKKKITKIKGYKWPFKKKKLFTCRAVKTRAMHGSARPSRTGSSGYPAQVRHEPETRHDFGKPGGVRLGMPNGSPNPFAAPEWKVSTII